MTKYEIPDDYEWADEKEPDEPEAQPVTVGTHFLTVNDERDGIEKYNGLQWSFLIDEGTITAVDKSHYCPGPSHMDPIGFAAWSDVPRQVRECALDALNGSVEEIVDVEAVDEAAEDQWP